MSNIYFNECIKYKYLKNLYLDGVYLSSSKRTAT